MLSRFDRGVELDWLADRPVVQQVIAELLGCTIADVRAPLAHTAEVNQISRRLRLEVLPQGQALDLLEENLPPGIPSVLTLPSTWARVVWLTRPGDGSTLLGQWLNARGRAEVRQVREMETLDALPGLGPPLYVEVQARRDIAGVPWRPQRPVCLAILQGETSEEYWESAGWTVIHSPALDPVLLHSMVSWVMQRIGNQSKLELEPALEWIQQSLIEPGLVETLGDVLGWCGHLAEAGLEITARRTTKQLLTVVLKRALAPLAKARDSTASSWSRKVPELLVAMAEHSLLTPDAELLSPRPLEAWVELLPEEDRVGPDLDWMKTHLSGTSKVIRPRDLERAAAQFPPGAHRWLGLLRDSGLLQPVNEHDYALRPHFVARLCRQIANDGLIHGSSAVWGTALFQARARPAVWRQLKRQADVNAEALLDSVLDELDEESAGTVLALDATVMAVGMSILSGKDTAGAAAEQLLDEACALALQHPDHPPTPRIGLGTLDGLDAKALWWLSLIALSEAPNRIRTSCAACLDPWNQKSPPVQLGVLLDNLQSQMTRLPLPRPEWVLGAFLMLDRLRQAIGAVLDNAGKPHSVLAPGIALDEIQHGVLEWASLVPILDSDLLYDVFVAMAEQRRVATLTWAESFWKAFEQSQVPIGAHDFVQKHLDVLSPCIPESLGLAWLDGVRPAPCDAVLGALPERIICAWLDRRQIGDASVPAVLIEHASEELLDRMLSDLDGDDELLLPLFWERVPKRVVTRLHRFRVLLPAKAARWIDMAPVAHSGALFKAAALDEWLKASEPLLMALRRFCNRCIEQRSENWQLAYHWLVRIERILRS
jgi:hypothetical protein